MKKSLRASVITAAFALLAMPLGAQTAALSAQLNNQFTDSVGRVLSSGLVYTCVAAQSCPGSPLATFTSSSGLTARSNPIVLGSDGRPNSGGGIWLSVGVAYKIVVTNSAGVPIPNVGGDNIYGGAISTTGGGGGGGGGGTPGTPVNSIQFNLGGNFTGTSALLWDNTQKVLTCTKAPGTACIVSAGGFIQSSGGFLSSVTGGSWQGFNSATDGMAIRGISVAQSITNTTGGYIDLAPITYNPNGGGPCVDVNGNAVQQPTTLNGLAGFGAHNAVMWVGTSPQMPASGCGATIPVDLDYGLNLNTYIFPRGGLATDNAAYNAINTIYPGAGHPAGGVTAGALIAGTLYPAGTVTSTSTLVSPAYLGGYVIVGSSATDPAVGTIATVKNPLVQGSGAKEGTLYYNTADDCLKVSNNALAYNCIGSGGGGSAAGANTQVQYNNASAFGATANFTWVNGTRLLTVTTADSAHPGMFVATGFMQADAGFLATAASATAFNAIQAPGGGTYALSHTALNYSQLGNYNDGTRIGIPPLTTGDSAQAGRVYWDCGAAVCSAGSGSGKIYNGTAWVTLATGGATSPGGANTNVQINSGGSFAGSANLTYASQTLTSIASSSSTAGVAVGTGFAQADQGFLATTATCVKYNCFQAATGGGAALSFTAVTYVQAGTYSSGGVGTLPTMTTSDSIHPGTVSWDTFRACLAVYNGSSMACLGSGSGGTPGGSNSYIQFNNAGAFGGSGNFIWNDTLHLLGISTTGATAGIAVVTGFIQADGGFLAPIGSCTLYNCIQAPGGGVYGKSVTALNYSQVGASAGTPPLTSGQGAFSAGALFYDTSAGALKVHNGSAFVTLATGGVSSVNAQTGAVTISGTANQVTTFTSGGTITLSTPQNIATNSAVQFGSVFTTGAISAAGVISSSTGLNITTTGLFNSIQTTGGVLSSGGYSTTNTATNSIQTPGGINLGNSGGSNGVLQVNGSTIINSFGQFVGANVLATGNVQTGGTFVVSGTFFGQTHTVTIGGCSIFFSGGIAYAFSGC